MNFPIYMILFGTAIFLSVTFYFLAGWLSKPIRILTKSTLALSNQDFSIQLPSYESNDEIGSLINSIKNLKINLIEQKSKNDKFVFGLEELIDKRAKDLKETQAQMDLAQKNAKFGTFQYSFLDDTWKSSEESLDFTASRLTARLHLEQHCIFWILLYDAEFVGGLASY